MLACSDVICVDFLLLDDHHFPMISINFSSLPNLFLIFHFYLYSSLDFVATILLQAGAIDGENAFIDVAIKWWSRTLLGLKCVGVKICGFKLNSCKTFFRYYLP